jgi:predicted  nucleic acid-binding Zn-ribbon protein
MRFRELQQKITSQEAMKKRIVEADVTLEDINKKYSSLQEEASEKTRKLKKIWSMFNAAKSELADIESENAREIESMLGKFLTFVLDIGASLDSCHIEKFIDLSILNYS